jgi:hypothetical protein
MGLFRKKRDPISERERMLQEQIAAIEAQIRHLSEHAAPAGSAPGGAPGQGTQPRLRSTAIPHGPTVPAAAAAGAPQEPVFEEVNPFKPPPEPVAPETANDLGVRREGLAVIWERLKLHLRGPTTSNPKLVNYLAAGSIQGLRPLRYEKRVARNRFIVLVILLILVLLGFFSVFVKGHW